MWDQLHSSQKCYIHIFCDFELSSQNFHFSYINILFWNFSWNYTTRIRLWFWQMHGKLSWNYNFWEIAFQLRKRAFLEWFRNNLRLECTPDERDAFIGIRPIVYGLLDLMDDVGADDGAPRETEDSHQEEAVTHVLLKWDTGFYTPPVLGRAALLADQNSGSLGHRLFFYVAGAERQNVRIIFPPPTPVDALNRCHLSNWRFDPETVHFLSSKRPFLPTMFVSKCYKTKHLAKIHFFYKKPKLGRKNHYFYSVKMGERAKSLWKPRFGPQSLKT